MDLTNQMPIATKSSKIDISLEKNTESISKIFTNFIKKGDTIFFYGEIGVGKTTFALEYLPRFARCTRFINTDLIAAGLSPLVPERELLAASRIFLGEIEELIGDGECFAFETTLG